MSFLLDTNVLSEAIARQPDSRVVRWVEAQPIETIYLSVTTIGEIDFGIARLPQCSKRERLEVWREKVVAGAGRRILPIDLAVAGAWGTVRAAAQRAKRTMSVVDAFLAATAEVHGLTLVTRNTKDFAIWGGPTFDPWSSG